MSRTNTIENTASLSQTSHLIANVVDPTQLSASFSHTEAIAALACAEALRHSKLELQLFENLLTQALCENLQKDKSYSEEFDSIEYLAKQLLPKSINTLQHFYAYSKDNDINFSEILKSTQQECDYDFLKFVTKIYSKAYLREIKYIPKSTNK